MKKKLSLGKKTKDGYQYAATVSLDQDLTTQIEEFVKEKGIKDSLKRETDKLSKIAKGFKNREKRNNLSYYYMIGKNLKFLEKPVFKKAKMWSVFRLIYELSPGLVPHVSDSNLGSKHIAMMFYLGKVNKKELSKATWHQWREIVKFKELFTTKRLYKKILDLIKGKRTSGPQFRNTIAQKIYNFAKHE